MKKRVGFDNYRYQQASVIACRLLDEGFKFGEELIKFAKENGMRFKNDNDMYDFEDMLLNMLEKKARYVKVEYKGITYKISRPSVLSTKIKCPHSTIAGALKRKNGIIDGCVKLSYGKWSNKELEEGVKFDDDKEIPYIYPSNNKARKGKYIDSPCIVKDIETGIIREYKTCRTMCDYHGIKYGRLVNYITRGDRFKRRFEISLKEGF